VWVRWVGGARRGDAAAREELSAYFTPFVHGALTAQLAVHLANEQVKLVLDDALRRIAEVKDPVGFGVWLLEQARRRAQQCAKSPNSTTELPGGGPNAIEGKKSLARLRQLPEPMRERLIFRLLEGITGVEIAEVTGALPNEVRTDLERGFALLVWELSGRQVSASSEGYLWSLAGEPHPQVVPLENQLTPLRFDPASSDGTSTGATKVRANSEVDVTPIGMPRFEDDRLDSEGRRQTSEHKPPSGPRRPATVDPDGTQTGRQYDEATSVIEPAKASSGRMPAGRAPPNAAASASDAGPSIERTQASADLPAAAQQNPFAHQPGTVQATDLPAAASVDRSSARAAARPAEETRNAPPDSLARAEPNATEIRPLPPPPLARRVERPGREPEPDTTAPRRGHLPLGDGPSNPSGPLTPSEAAARDWRTQIADIRPRAPAPEQPQAFSLTRGPTPFVMAAVLFLFFVTIAWVNLRGTERGVKRGWNLVPVTVAAMNIAEGTMVDFEMISTREVPEQFVTASVVKPDSSAYIVNQRIMVPVQAGDPLLWSQFETARSSERLSKRINKRARAFTVDARSIVSVGGWVRPGDHIDLIISLQDANRKERTSSTTLQNLQVLATGKITQSTNIGLLRKGQQEYQNVSVLALPEEIEILALMNEKAHFQMVLRNEEDFDLIEAGKSTAETLINGDRVEVLRKKRFQTIQLIRNTTTKPVDASQQPKR
jgi:pilus assembly protein CpaB